MTKTFITIYTSDEIMLGSASDDSINLSESVEQYHAQLRKEINQAYPEATIEFHHGFTTKTYDVEVQDGEAYDWDKQDEIKNTLENIIDRVYNNGTFWVSNF